ncbi:MAG: PEP-CTERM sorting domain-containing protein, partial [Bryobacteraceae bacterium]
ISNLPAGQYCIGMDANNKNDPAFTLVFNTPVSGVPEPSCFVLLATGLGTFGALRLKKNRSRKDS